MGHVDKSALQQTFSHIHVHSCTLCMNPCLRLWNDNSIRTLTRAEWRWLSNAATAAAVAIPWVSRWASCHCCRDALAHFACTVVVCLLPHPASSTVCRILALTLLGSKAYISRRVNEGDHNVISGFERPLPKEHRPIFSVDNLPAQRELLVRRSQGEGLVGKILVTAEHKLVDVVQNLRDVLKLESITQIYRGVAGLT